MARTWVILGRVSRGLPILVLAPDEAPAGGDGEAQAAREAEAHGADAQAGVGVEEAEAAAPHGADFSIPVKEPPRITIMNAAPTAHPSSQRPDILCVDSDCILLNFGVERFMGACFDDRPDQSDLIVERDYNWAGVEQGHPATAERIPPRDSGQAIVSNVDSIGLIYGLDPDEYVIAELILSKGSDRATLVYFYPGLHSNWHQVSTDNPSPWLQQRDREWIPSSFHGLPEGQNLDKAQRVHERRCIAVSKGGLRYISITPDGDEGTVSMWTRVPSDHVHDGTVGWMWEKEFTVSFAEIWEHDSYTATGLPHKVPVLAAVSPTDANVVYFALEDPKRLFGVNMDSHRVEEFIDESYEMLVPGPEAPPSCRYVIPWFLPLEVAQAHGEDPLAAGSGIDWKELKNPHHEAERVGFHKNIIRVPVQNPLRAIRQPNPATEPLPHAAADPRAKLIGNIEGVQQAIRQEPDKKIKEKLVRELRHLKAALRSFDNPAA